MSIHGGSRHGSIAPSVKSQRLQPPPTPTTPMPVVGILKSAKSYTNLPPPPAPPPTHADHYKAYSSKRCDTFFFRINSSYSHFLFDSLPRPPRGPKRPPPPSMTTNRVPPSVGPTFGHQQQQQARKANRFRSRSLEHILDGSENSGSSASSSKEIHTSPNYWIQEGSCMI